MRIFTVFKPVLRLARVVRDEAGIAATEFALIFPFLIVLMMGGSELIRFVYISRSMTNLANSLATIVAERTTAYNFNDAVFVYYSALVTSPFLLQDAASRGTTWNFDVAMTTSSVIFSPTVQGCTSNCTYTGKVSWSVNSPIAGQRSCLVQPVAVADSAAPSLTTLPKDAFTSGSIIVADVVYYYTPIFGKSVIPAVTIRRSFYMQPRYMSSIPYQTGVNSSINDVAYTCG